MFDSHSARAVRLVFFGALLAPFLAAAQLHPGASGPEPTAASLEALLALGMGGDIALESGPCSDLGVQPAGGDPAVGELDHADDLSTHADLQRAECIVLANRGLKATDWMSRAFPRIKKKHVFRYAGNLPHSFATSYAPSA